MTVAPSPFHTQMKIIQKYIQKVLSFHSTLGKPIALRILLNVPSLYESHTFAICATTAMEMTTGI